MDKMHWMADQSVENGTAQDGCLEHMLDRRSIRGRNDGRE
jgi:hypothetical protein